MTSAFEKISTELYPTSLLHSFAVNGKISGSIGAVGEMQDVLPIVHGPIGCGYHYRHSARRRHQPFYDVISSDLPQQEIIFGGLDKLIATIEAAWKQYHPQLVMIIPTPVSDLINEEVERAAEICRQRGLLTVAIRSELFSHRDKTYSRRRLQEISNMPANSMQQPKIELKGCGFTEALYAIVEQVMQPCEVTPLSVNIETVGWGDEGRQALHEIEAFLKQSGITVITWIPSAPIEEMIKAPSAQLNLVKRIRWARRMKERFGTDYIQIGSGGRFAGLDGICRFYQDVAQALGVSKAMEEIICQAKEDALLSTLESRTKMKETKAVLVVESVSQACEECKKYAQDFSLDVRSVILSVTQEKQRSLAIDHDTKQRFIERTCDAVATYCPDAQVLWNPCKTLLYEEIAQADVVVGSNDITLEGHGAAVILPRFGEMSLSFKSYIRAVNRMEQAILNSRENKGLLLQKIAFDSSFPSLLHDKNTLAAKELWTQMWLEKEG